MDFIQIIVLIFVSFVGGVLASKYIFYSNRIHTLEIKLAASEAGNSELKKKMSKIASEAEKIQSVLQENITTLETEKSKIQTELLKFTDKKTILAEYKWNEVFQTPQHKKDHYFICAVCIDKFPPVISRLYMQEQNAYRCRQKDCHELYEPKQSDSEPSKNWNWLTH